MTTALEDQLLEARTQVDDLTRDYHAQTELLTENSTALDALRGEVETLTAQLESLTTERDSAAQESATLHSRITALQTSQADFDRRLQLEVARVVASTGTTLPTPFSLPPVRPPALSTAFTLKAIP